ncbi:hypothetical protein QJQ45_008750 [Haematococcus lacustris]|nr:hypothetical protein QJQ45_008750 [Haematococcus lacustris]
MFGCQRMCFADVIVDEIVDICADEASTSAQPSREYVGFACICADEEHTTSAQIAWLYKLRPNHVATDARINVDEAKKVLTQYLTLLQPVLKQLLGRPLNALATIITDPTWQRCLNRKGELVATLAKQLAQAQAPHTDFLPVGQGMDDGLVFLLALQDFPLVAYMGSHKLSQLAAAHCWRTADGKKQVVEVEEMDALALTLPHQLGTEVLVKAGQLVLFRGNTVHAGNMGVAGSCCARLYGFGRPDTVADNTTMNTSELGDLYHGLFQPIQDEGIGPKMADWNRRAAGPCRQTSQDPVGVRQNPVDNVAGPCRTLWCLDPVVWCQDPVSQDPVVKCQDPVGQDLVVWCQDPVVWCQDPVGQNPVVRCQDPVVWCQDPVGQDPVVWCQDPVSQDPVVWCQDPVEKDTRRTLYRLLHEAHDAVTSAHLGRAKTLERLQRHFYWPQMEHTVREYVRTCDQCQRNKATNQVPPGLLQPLPIPNRNWQHVSMDFIGPLPPTSHGYDMVVSVVDKLSKMLHLIPTTATATAPDIAKLFFDHVFRDQKAT